MKDKRNYLFYLLVTILFVCTAGVDAVNAAGSPSLSASASAASVKEGGLVNVSVNLSGNPSISTFGAALGYDSSVLSYEGVSWNGGFSGSDMQMASDTGSEVNLSVVCEESYSADGAIATVKFRGVSDAASIPVTLSLRDMSDADLEAVTDCKISGKVRVPQSASDTTGKTNQADKSKPAANDKPKKENGANAENDKNTQGASQAGAANTAASSTVSNSSNATDTASANAAGVAANTALTNASSQGNKTVSSNAAGAVTAQAKNMSESGGQGAVQKAQAVTVLETGSAKPDQSYKTGGGIGNDIFLILAAACGIFSLLLLVLKRGEDQK